MLVQTLFKKHEKTMEDGFITPIESGQLLDNAPAIVLIDLGLCGVDGWSCYDVVHNRVGQCQENC